MYSSKQNNFLPETNTNFKIVSYLVAQKVVQTFTMFCEKIDLILNNHFPLTVFNPLHSQFQISDVIFIKCNLMNSCLEKVIR